MTGAVAVGGGYCCTRLRVVLIFFNFKDDSCDYFERNQLHAPHPRPVKGGQQSRQPGGKKSIKARREGVIQHRGRAVSTLITSVTGKATRLRGGVIAKPMQLLL